MVVEFVGSNIGLQMFNPSHEIMIEQSLLDNEKLSVAADQIIIKISGGRTEESSKEILRSEILFLLLPPLSLTLPLYSFSRLLLLLSLSLPFFLSLVTSQNLCQTVIIRRSCCCENFLPFSSTQQ